MLSFHDAAASPSAVADTHLKRLLTDAVSHWHASDLLGMTHLLIIGPGDTETAIREAVGFSPLVDPVDGHRVGSPAVTPYWNELRDHGGWFELTMTVGNSGFAFVLFIQDAEGTDPELLRLCRTHAEGAPPCTGF
jgi:hypothetical protein